MDMQPVEEGSGLDNAIDEFVAAARKYREFIKRNYRDRLAGVLVARSGTEMVVYSECERYSNQIAELTFDSSTDRFVAERSEPDED